MVILLVLLKIKGRKGVYCMIICSKKGAYPKLNGKMLYFLVIQKGPLLGLYPSGLILNREIKGKEVRKFVLQ